MKLNRFLLDLRMFDGDSGEGTGDDNGYDFTQAENGSADNGSGENAADESQTADETGKDEPEDLDKEFDELIKGKYREQFKARQQNAIKARFRENNAAKQEADKAAELKSVISMRYGLKDASTDDVINAIKRDESFLEEAAAREGLSTEQFRKLSEMQQRADASERKLGEMQKAQMRQDAQRKLEEQTAACRELFPDFDFEQEAGTNETFRNMILSGADVTSAYKFAHMDELITGGMAKAAQRGAAETAKAVRNNLRRPQEAGARGGAAATVNVDFGKMSSEEFNAYRDRVMSGEI